MYREAFAWVETGPCVAQFHQNDDFIIYYLKSENITENYSKEKMIELKTFKYETFDDFKANFNKIYSVKLRCSKKIVVYWINM